MLVNITAHKIVKTLTNTIRATVANLRRAICEWNARPGPAGDSHFGRPPRGGAGPGGSSPGSRDGGADEPSAGRRAAGVKHQVAIGGRLVGRCKVGADRMRSYHLRNFIGNPTDTAIAAASLIFGGVLDAYPTLDVVLPHVFK